MDPIDGLVNNIKKFISVFKYIILSQKSEHYIMVIPHTQRLNIGYIIMKMHFELTLHVGFGLLLINEVF